METIWNDLPRDMVHLILRYDGRIKYKNGKYFDINKIDTSDNRYDVIQPVIHKKIILLDLTDIDETGFYFEFEFDTIHGSGLCYDYNFTNADEFEICYYNDLHEPDFIQIRTIYQ